MWLSICDTSSFPRKIIDLYFKSFLRGARWHKLRIPEYLPDYRLRLIGRLCILAVYGWSSTYKLYRIYKVNCIYLGLPRIPAFLFNRLLEDMCSVELEVSHVFDRVSVNRNNLISNATSFMKQLLEKFLLVNFYIPLEEKYWLWKKWILVSSIKHLFLFTQRVHFFARK